MGHEHEVPGLVPVVVYGVVVDVAEDGPGSQPVRAVLAVDVLAQLVHNLMSKTKVVTVLRFSILEQAGKLDFFASSFEDPMRTRFYSDIVTRDLDLIRYTLFESVLNSTESLRDLADDVLFGNPRWFTENTNALAVLASKKYYCGKPTESCPQ